MRPRGEISNALLQAARAPGTVKQLCQRAQVGYGAGQYTATRLVQRGDLVAVGTAQPPGPGRPAVVVQAAEALAPQGDEPDDQPWDGLVTWAFA